MKINYEFLDEEAIENVITCLNYKIDKVVFWGFEESIKKLSNRTESFLMSYCDVSCVEFIELSSNNFFDVIDDMKEQIQKELNIGNEIFFDITGGESFLLVAFGMMSKTYNLPIHMYDVTKDMLIEIDQKNERPSFC